MNKELKQLIEKYCMGMQATDAQMDEIMDKAAEAGADFQEVSSYIKEMQNGPTREERLEAERKAKEEAERKAREEAERKAREKAERERKAKEKAEREAREKAERERREREEAERRAREKAERERREREEAERKAREEAERKAEYERRMREDPAFARAERKKAKEEAKRKAKEEAERKAAEKAMRRAVKRAVRKEKFKRAMKRVVLPIFIVMLLVAGAYLAWRYWDKIESIIDKIQGKEVLDVQGEDFTVNGVTFKMVAVKGGTFGMGSGSGSDDEKPHSETVSDFMIGETEVTQALWKAVMEDNPSKYKGKDRPVQNVSWYDCQKFVKRLSQLTSRNFRLPTEAEWEYAARGGHKSKGIYDYSGSNKAKKVAWYDCFRPHKVKTKLPNELGVYDMSGNVEEWCEDWFNGKTNSWEEEDKKKVCRGGSIDMNEYWCRVFDRSYGDPQYDRDSRGFRLVLSDESVPEEEEVTEEISDELSEMSIKQVLEIKQVLQSYCDAIADNDFYTLNQLYAPVVERYQSAYNEERSKVVERHRKYDETFNVYGKHSNIRWETLEIGTSEDGRITAVIMEDFAIDREDKTKDSQFVLEKHFVLDEDNRIVEVWDNQLSSSK